MEKVTINKLYTFILCSLGAYDGGCLDADEERRGRKGRLKIENWTRYFMERGE